MSKIDLDPEQDSKVVEEIAAVVQTEVQKVLEEKEETSDSEKLVLLFKGLSVIFSILGFCLLIFSAIVKFTSDNGVCGQISKAMHAGKDLSAIASPLQINLCGLKRCSFDLGQCASDCPLGYLTNEYQCPTSCFCYGEGIMQGDIEFKAQDVPYLTMLFDDNSTFGMIDAAVLFDGVDHQSYLHSTWRSKKSRHTIPYMFGPKIGNSTKKVIKKVLSSFSVQVCIDFVERTNEEDYINFVDGKICSSRIGKTRWANTVTINEKSCVGEAAIEHLIIHALGMHHQQTRVDRDDYINIVEDNIMTGYNKQFSAMREDLYLDLGVEYNTESLMHFVNTVYSTNGKPTITGRNDLTIRGETYESLSQGLQSTDKLALNSLYKCKGHKAETNTAMWSEWKKYTSSDFKCRKYRLCRGKGKRSLSIYCEPGPEISWYQEAEGTNCEEEPSLDARGRSGITGRAGADASMFVESSTKMSRYICAGGTLHKAAFNSDGKDDLLCLYQDGYAQIYMARQNGQYISPEWEGQTSLCKYGGVPESRLVPGDFDGDGMTDLMCHSSDLTTVTLFTGSGLDGGIDWKGTFPDCQGKVVRAIDLNGDFRDDIVCGQEKKEPYHYEFAFMNTFTLSK